MLPSGTVTFLFTDIEASTQLWESHPEAMRAALARHDRLLRQIIEANEGYVFRTVGDAFCSAFPTVPSALAAALAAQRALSAEPWGTTPIRVRMALHPGAADERDGDYFGPPLNRVARLLAAAHGGQVLLSAPTHELAAGQLPRDVHLRDLGEHELKGHARPEHIFQLLAPDLPTDFPPLPTLRTRPTNLPGQLSSFIGREEELAGVNRLLSKTRLLTLTGSGGVGKTRLALQAAADALDAYPDGVWWVELAPLADPLLVPQAVAAALGVRDSPGRPLTTVLSDHLCSKQVLLVLDNCEHLIGACAQLADSLLRVCSHVRILATSRELLDIPGEVPFRVPSLSLPSRSEVESIEQLAQFDGVRLFTERAQATLPEFTLTRENAPAVAQVCRQVDGIPLAIELAAARVKMLRVEEIVARLGDSLRLLTGGSRTALPRHQTLNAAIEWSYCLLTEPERTLFRRLSIFAGGWTLDAAEVVCADTEDHEGMGTALEGPEVLELLGHLVDKSLVVVEQEQRQTTRYRLLETVRQFAHDQLRETGEENVLRAQHLGCFLDLAERADPELHGPQQMAWLDRLEQEHGNFRTALKWSFQTGQVESALRLSIALAWFWWVRGYLREGDRWLTRGVDESEDRESVSLPLRAKVLRAARMMTLYIGDHWRTKSLAEEALALAREMGDQKSIASALGSLASVAHADGDVPRATALHEEALATLGEADLQDASPTILYNLALLLSEQGNYPRASSLLTTALAICEATGDKTRMGWMYRAQGVVALHQGYYEQAARLFRESLSLLWEVGEKLGIAEAFELLASVAAERQHAPGNAQRAARLFGAAELLREEIGSPTEVPDAAEYDRRITRARDLVGEPVFAAAWAEGRTMTLEQAVEYALES